MGENQDTLYAYLAGLIDGEGTITLIKHKKGDWQPIFNASISIGMTVKDSIELFHQTFGGSLYEEKRRGGHKTMYRCRITGNKSVPPVLKILLPYLRVKKAQAVAILAFCEERKSFNGTSYTGGTPKEEYTKRENYYNQIKELNR